MFGKLIGAVIGAPLRVVNLGAKVVEATIRWPSDLGMGETLKTPITDAVRDGIGKVEDAIEKGMDD